VAQAIHRDQAKNGPDALAFISSSECTNEESYLHAKVGARGHRHEQHGNCSRYCQAPATEGLSAPLVYGGDSGSIPDDIENAGMVLIIGSNHGRGHPVLATRVKQAHKLRGQKTCRCRFAQARDGRTRRSLFSAETWNGHRWLCAITRYILDNGLEKTEFLDQWVNGLDEYYKSWNRSHWSLPRRPAELTVELLKQVAHMIVEAQ